MQQHEEQLEQAVGVWQVAHDVSPQPHVWQADDEDPNVVVGPKTFVLEELILLSHSLKWKYKGRPSIFFVLENLELRLMFAHEVNEALHAT